MLTGFQGAQHFVIRKNGRHWIKAPRQRFAEERDICLDAIVLLSEQLAGTAESGLDLIEDQHYLVRCAELAYLCEISGRREDDPSFSLDWLDKEADRVRCYRLLQRLGVAEGYDLEAWRERSEMLMCGRVGAEANDTEGASVEVVCADDDLGLPVRHFLHFVSPFAYGLDRALYRLGTAVHGQYLVGTGELCDLLVEGSQLVVVERAGSQRQLASLFHHCG